MASSSSLQQHYRGEDEDSVCSSSDVSTADIEGDLGMYLEQLEEMECWDERSKCVASVLGDVFTTIEQIQGSASAQGLSPKQQKLQEGIQRELGEVRTLVRNYIQRHPSISEDMFSHKQ